METVRHVRRHWKKYVAGQTLGMLLTSYLVRKYRDKNVIREQCNKAKVYGERKADVYERPKKLLIFLNTSANNLDAKIQFTKYAVPLLALSGIDYTVVESEYRGHIQALMQYVDSNTDGIVVAGGDGTIMEVLNGLLRRQDAQRAKNMVLGILPLGKNNLSFRALFPAANWASPARSIGEATLKVIDGVTNGWTRPVPVIELQPDKGHTVFALCSVQWGAFKDAFENRNKFRIFGKLRLMASYLSTALRHWPQSSSQLLWLPNEEASGPHNAPTLTATAMAALRGWVKLEEAIVGYRVRSSPAKLALTVWPESLVSKSDFLKCGWHQTVSKTDSCEGCSSKDYLVSEVVVTPRAEGAWVSVDGEEYEAVPVAIKLRPQYLLIFS